jgi:hypothetical protein
MGRTKGSKNKPKASTTAPATPAPATPAPANQEQNGGGAESRLQWTVPMVEELLHLRLETYNDALSRNISLQKNATKHATIQKVDTETLFLIVQYSH